MTSKYDISWQIHKSRFQQANTNIQIRNYKAFTKFEGEAVNSWRQKDWDSSWEDAYVDDGEDIDGDGDGDGDGGAWRHWYQ